MIPYEDRFTLVGTTDVRLRGRRRRGVARATPRVDYLCRAVGRYLAQPPAPADVLWRYAGVRPLYDDGSQDPSAITRDYTLRVDDVEGAAPVLSVFGGKITTYRRLAEHALEKLAPYFPAMKPAWTGERAAARQRLRRARSAPSASCLRALSRRSRRTCCRASSAATARSPREVLATADLGEYYGAGLTERELAT